MPKMKTNKGAAKRFKLTAKGKIKRKKAGMRHLLSSKSKRSKRNLNKPAYVSKGEARTIKRLLALA